MNEFFIEQPYTAIKYDSNQLPCIEGWKPTDDVLTIVTDYLKNRWGDLMSEMRQITTIVVYAVIIIIGLLMPITITYSEIAAPPSRQPTTITNVAVTTNTTTTPKATTGQQQQDFESITIILDDDSVIFNGTKVNMTLIEGKGIAIITPTTSGEEITDVFKEEPIPATPISNVGDLFENE
jgi:cytoskeletal protein RodZ